MADTESQTTEKDIITVQSKLMDYYDSNISYDEANEAFERLVEVIRAKS